MNKRKRWFYKDILKSSKKYNNVREWLEKDPGAYYAASRLKLLPKLTKHMQRKIVAYNYYSKENLTKIAKKFKTVKEWNEKDTKSLAAAYHRKLLNDKKVTGHLLRIKGSLPMKWTKDKVLKAAKKYSSKIEWRLNSVSSYSTAKQKGWINEASKHMVLLGSKYKRCIYSLKIKNKKIIYIGLTFNLKKRIKDHFKTKRFKRLIQEYGKKNIITKQLTPYIDRAKASKLEIKLIKEKLDKGYSLLNVAKGGGLGGDERIWTEKKIIESALKFKTKLEWNNAESGAYQAAKARGIYKKVTKHMQKRGYIIKWFKEEVLRDAKKYKYRSEWWSKSVGAADAAKKNGWFEEAVKHMKNKK